ncbi:hypothetical protein BSKO_05201 [Bryopsis sp. KO-2023]|nr:hypothetical protein BSKO_05201 [Bryopsis sp. KO-2023]
MDASGSKGTSLFPLHGLASSSPQEDAVGSWQHCSSFKSEAPAQRPEEDDGLRARAAALLTSDESDSGGSSFDSIASREKKAKRKRSSKKRKKREHDDKKGRKKPKSELDKILELEKRYKSRGNRGEGATGVQGWFQHRQSAARNSADIGYYFDEKGDFDNVVYEGLYRMVVPAYRRKGLVGRKTRNTSAGELTRLRFFSSKSMMRERSRRLKKYRLLFRLKPETKHNGGAIGLSLPPPAKMDLTVDDPVQGEDDEQYILRRTKEFNIATRERPFEMELWIEFARFQDEANKLLRRKASERSTAERKIAILERGLSFHPGAEDLVLLLLDCVELIEDGPSVLARWERVIDNSPGSPRIWSAYIQWRKSQFGNFSVSSIDSLYAQALQSLAVERSRQARLGVRIKKLIEIEEGLARLALLSIQFDMQSGYSEHAIAKIQAIMEWHFLRPKELQTGANSSSLSHSIKKFWHSGVARIGEPGAKGWASWVLGDSSEVEEKADSGGGGEVERGECVEEGAGDEGWSGWVEVAKGKDLEVQDFPSDSDDEGSGSGLEGGDSSISGSHTEAGETEEELMERLGLKKLEEDMAKLEQQKDIPPDVLAEWLEREQHRQNNQWKPRILDDDGEIDDIEFEDIQEWVFHLDTPAVRDSLAIGCLELLGVDVGSEICSNDPALAGIRENTEKIDREFGELLFDEQIGFLHPGGEDPDSTKGKMRRELCSRWLEGSKETAGFVSRMLGTLAGGGVFRDSVVLCKEWILAEAVAGGGGSDDGKSVQEAGRKLLGACRNHIMLWVAYARLEAEGGKPKAARKIYDGALASLPTLTLAAQSQHPILAFNYADLEASKGSTEAQQHALNTLFHLALGTPYRPFEKNACIFDIWQDSDVTMAKRGFQERVAKAVCFEGGGVLDSCQVSWVMAGALFEEVWGAVTGVDGISVAINMLRNVMESTEDAVRAQSRSHENLQIRLCRIMVNACRNATPATVSPKDAREALIEGLTIYPRCSTLLKMLIAFERQAYASTRLSRFLSSQCTAHPSSLNHLLALGVELLRPMARLHSNTTIERALRKKEVSCSPLIWVVYLLLESSRAGASGKRVMLRGIRSCPWAKGLWLGGLRNVGSSALGDTEVGEFLDVMKNKGVKIRTDVYEVLLERLDVGN